MPDFDEIDAELDALETQLDSAASVTSTFQVELEGLQVSMAETSRYFSTLESGISSGLRRAFDGLVLDGAKLSDTLSTLANSIANTAYSAAIKPVTNHFGGIIAQGVNSFVTGLTPFAKGGVVSGPTAFPMQGGGGGLMGEAGPEAIMPLARTADGSLGVRGMGGGGVNITMNVSTPDVAGFQRSKGQIASQLTRALSAGQRNL